MKIQHRFGDYLNARLVFRQRFTGKSFPENPGMFIVREYWGQEYKWEYWEEYWGQVFDFEIQ